MVEQRSPTPLMWVQILLPLPIYYFTHLLVGFLLVSQELRHTKSIQMIDLFPDNTFKFYVK